MWQSLLASAADGNIQRHNLTDGSRKNQSMTPVDNINTGGSVVSPFCRFVVTVCLDSDITENIKLTLH